ncbi:MAG: hypothetical protein Q4F57_06035 [Weeksellaceae bacterium]|nr:hypothetical protein [Weeksellaceae bacterium]
MNIEYRDLKDVKREILEHTSGGLDIILSIFPHATDRKNFKIREEKTASASLNKAADGNWLVTDFGGEGVPKNAIRLFAEENNITWTEACLQLARSYGIATGLNAPVAEATFNSYPIDEFPHELDADTGYYIEITDEFTKKDLQALGPWVTPESAKICNCYKVVSYAKEYTRKDGGGKYIMQRSSNEDYPIFAFVNKHDGKKFYKIYQPKSQDKKYKFMFIGGRPKGFVNGLNQLQEMYKPKLEEWENRRQKAIEQDLDFQEPAPKKVEQVLIASGERDALNLTSMGFIVVWHNSETAEWEKKDIKKLYENADSIVNVPDIDDTGQRQGKALAEKFLTVKTLWLPDFLRLRKDYRGNSCKDMTDYFNVNRHKDKRDFLADLKNKISRSLALQFWESTATDKGIRWSFSNVLLNNFLQHFGFYRYEMPGSKQGWIFVRVRDHLVEKVEVGDIFGFIDNFLDTRNLPLALRDLAITSTNLSEGKLARIKSVDLNFKNFSKWHQTFSFSHQTWKVDKNGISVTTGKHSNYVWEHDVIDKKIADLRDLKPVPEQITILPEFFKITKIEDAWDIELFEKDCDFFNFIINISRVYWRDEYITPWAEKVDGDDVIDIYALQEQAKYREDNKFNIAGPLLTQEKIHEQKLHLINKIYTIGYLLHAYKDEANGLLVYLMENDLIDSDVSSGGSGKSLFAKSFNEIVEVVNRPGNNKDIFTDKFVFDGVTENTRLFVFDDADKYLNPRDLYSQVSGDLYVNPKNGTAYTLPYKSSPKFVITSNFGLRNMDGSTIRRLLVAATSNYYHVREGKYLPGRMPPDDFGGKRFFQDWDMVQYNKFINFYLQCLVFFLNCKEKVNPPMNSITKRNLAAQIGKHFMDWADEFFRRVIPDQAGMIEYNKVDLKREVQQYHKSIAGMSSAAIATSLEAYCMLHGYEYMPGRDRYQKNVDGKTQDFVLIHVGRREAEDFPF